MLHLLDLRKNKDQIVQKLKIKNFDAHALVSSAISKDDERKTIQQKSDELLSEQNKIAKQIGQFFKSGKIDQANELKQSSSNLKKESQKLLSSLHKIEDDIFRFDDIYGRIG